MASVDVASPPTNDPYKSFAYAHPNFNLWSVSTEPQKNKPVVEYGKANDKSFTIRVVHGEFFTDYPGKAYQQTKVHFISHVNIDLLDMELLGCFSRSLGYTSLGNWYHMPIGEHTRLSTVPILNDECLEPFKTLVRAHKFKENEHLYVKHRPVFVPNNFPHFLMNSPAKRVEKLIHMFVIEHPTAWFDDGIAYIQHMLNMTIPREKMKDATDMAKENATACTTRKKAFYDAHCTS
ncbi:unnamed protein product [Lactuca saligna]|uniref:Uncharacterized protein n=1 Tax=Lactuca saligna TaxID=75948 RepID=A0AA36A150_LACSI|nr:unnamed protein product [Lactuca saligna]